MRVREWYGWHFPEMGKIVNDNILYAKVSSAAGFLPLRLGYPLPPSAILRSLSIPAPPVPFHPRLFLCRATTLCVSLLLRH